MSTFNSLATCIIMAIYASLVSAATSSILDALDANIEHGIDYVAEKLATSTEATVHRPVNCLHENPAQSSHDDPCPLGTYKLLLQSLINNSDLLKSKPKTRDDYQYTPNVGLHKLHNRPETWQTARRICREEGGHLAIVNSRDEARALTELCNRTSNLKDGTDLLFAHIGIHDYFSEGDWVTVLDDPLSATGFTKWSDKWGGQPDNVESENCGVFVVEDSSLADISCNAPCAFICELPMEEHM